MARAADGLGWTPLEVALVWVRDRPGVTAPIVGRPHGRPAQGALWASRSWPCPTRSSTPSTTSPETERAATRATLRPLGRGVEWEFEKLLISREHSRNVVTRMLVERAEHGGWELDRVQIAPDGTRRVVLRRKIIRQLRTSLSRAAQDATSSRNRSNTRAPNSSASTGTRSSTPWNSAVKSRSAGSRSGAKP